MEKREPCPFCGNAHMSEFALGKANAYTTGHYWYIICSCGAQGPFGNTVKDAEERWDRRKVQ